MIKYLFFGLYDVLVKGKLNIKPDTSYFSDLITFSKEKKINLFLITDTEKDDSEGILKESGIFSYFYEKNIINITSEYYNSLSDFDKELKKEAKLKDKNYTDKYFKVYYFNSVFKKNKEKTLYVGHDIWSDCYYLHKYANINSVLLKDTLSNNYAPNLLDITKFSVVSPTLDSFKNHLLKKQVFDYTYLESYANKLLFNEILGKNLKLAKVMK